MVLEVILVVLGLVLVVLWVVLVRLTIRKSDNYKKDIVCTCIPLVFLEENSPCILYARPYVRTQSVTVYFSGCFNKSFKRLALALTSSV